MSKCTYNCNEDVREPHSCLSGGQVLITPDSELPRGEARHLIARGDGIFEIGQANLIDLYEPGG